MCLNFLVTAAKVPQREYGLHKFYYFEQQSCILVGTGGRRQGLKDNRIAGCTNMLLCSRNPEN